MTGEPSALLALALDDLVTARRDLDAGAARHAVSRAYYAAFHAVSAALVAAGAEAATHKGAHRQFSNAFLREERLPRSLGTTLSTLFQLRQDADYDAGRVMELDVARRAVVDATALVDRIAAWLADAASEHG